jgi:hypothetical protein
MSTVDLLHDLYYGKISEEKAYSIFDSIISSEQAPYIKEKLQLSNEEWTAFCQSAPFKTIAKWRYEGWPSICNKCKGKLTISKYGWFVTHVGSKITLEHVECPGQ